MNVNTGELRLIDEALSTDKMKEELKKSGFTQVPKKHQAEANKELGDKDSVIVDMKKDTPLTDWANKKREKIESKKHKALKAEKKRRNLKTSKQSRKVNRV